MQAVRVHLKVTKPGTVFTPAELIAKGFGSPIAVRQTLCRLIRSGEIVRLRRGYYVRPHARAKTAPIIQPEDLTRAFARKTALRKTRNA